MKLEEVTFTNVGGLKTACIDRKQLVELMAQRVLDYNNPESNYYQKTMTIFSANGHSISIANSDKEMGRLLNSADILHADGQSVVSFSRRFGENPIPERSATTDTIHDYPLNITSNTRHYLLGAKQSTIEKCADIMSQNYKNFLIAGTRNGYFNIEENQAVVAGINKAKPDILWVGLGKPKEQEFIRELKSSIDVPVIISCGGCYNFVTGEYKRAPEIMQKLGLEWLHRMATEPKKLFWRYLTTNPHAIYCVVKHSRSSKS